MTGGVCLCVRWPCMPMDAVRHRQQVVADVKALIKAGSASPGQVLRMPGASTALDLLLIGSAAGRWICLKNWMYHAQSVASNPGQGQGTGPMLLMRFSSARKFDGLAILLTWPPCYGAGQKPT